MDNELARRKENLQLDVVAKVQTFNKEPGD